MGVSGASASPPRRYYALRVAAVLLGVATALGVSGWISVALARLLPGASGHLLAVKALLVMLGAGLPLAGLGYGLPLVVSASSLLAYSLGLEPEPRGLEWLLAASIVAGILDLYASRLGASGRVVLGKAPRRAWSLASLPALNVLIMVLVIVSFAASLLGAFRASLARLPYTLKEFYFPILSTRAGLAVLVSVVLALAARVSYWLLAPLLEAATATPESARAELRKELAREIERGIIAGGEAGAYIPSAASTFLSLLLLPLIATLAGFVKGLVAAYKAGGLMALASGLLVYAVAWEALRRLARGAIAAVTASSKGSPAALGATPRPYGRRVLLKAASTAALGLAAALAAGLLLAVVAYYPSEGIAKAVRDAPRGLYLALHGWALGGPLASLEAYARSYDEYLSDYIRSLDELLSTLIRLLWGR